MTFPSPLIIPYGGISPIIAPDAFIAPNATVIGDVVIGTGSNIWFGCILRGDVHSIRVGARVNVQDGTIVHVTKHASPTTIGDEVSIGHQALIHGCVLESGSFVGMGAIVMDGVVVETGAFVAAGALVTPNKIVPQGELWAGRPARFLRHVNEDDRAVMARTVPRYVGLGQEYRAILGNRAMPLPATLPRP